MKSLLKLFLFLLISFHSYSQEDSHYYTEKDDFKGITRNYLDFNELANPRLSFNLQQIKNDAGSAIYIEIIYGAGDGWLFLFKDKVSMILLVDGEKKEFYSTLVDQEVKKGAKEYAYYAITGDELYSLSQAKEIRIRIYGDKGDFETYFKEINIKRLYVFWDKFIFNK